MGLFFNKKRPNIEIEIDLDLDDEDDEDDEDEFDDDYDYVRGYNGGWIRAGIHEDAPESKITFYDKLCIQDGYKPDFIGGWRPPDTVYKENEKSHVYHSLWYCKGKAISEHPIAMKESDTLAWEWRCPDCDWVAHDDNIKEHERDRFRW